MLLCINNSMKWKQHAMSCINHAKILQTQALTLNIPLFQQSKTDTASYVFSLTIIPSTPRNAV